MPLGVLMDDFPQYLPFVNRQRQVADCVSHFAKAFDTAYGTESDQKGTMDSSDAMHRTPNPAQEAARKNYKMVIAAGGPGIGQQPPPHTLSVHQLRVPFSHMLVLTVLFLSVALC
jgi:hypothetical protein